MNRSTYNLLGIITLLTGMWGGPVLAAVSVVITPTGSFNITPGVAVSNQSIGSVLINADLSSYEVTLRDDNNGLLKNGVNSMSYTVKYNGGAQLTLSTTPLSVETGTTVTDGNRTLTIFVPAIVSIGIPAGNYTATITVELLAL